jgi:hypothetical protein
MKNLTNNTLQISSAHGNEEKKKASLLKSLAKKRQTLMQITAKVEMLRMDLDIVKREYDVRIGKLYLKDDQLDLEIIRYNRIKSLLEEGCTYEQAVKRINEFYDEEKNIFTMKFEEIAEEEIEIAKRKKLPEEEEQDVKKLWKKLLFQLHPDLTADTAEKKERETIMRRINTAYAENDYQTLKRIEQQHYVDDPNTTSVEQMEKSLVSLENAIIALQQEHKDLRNSEWYMWKKKSEFAKRKNVDLFKELEEELLNNIARKIKVVHAFRDEFDKKGYY